MSEPEARREVPAGLPAEDALEPRFKDIFAEEFAERFSGGKLFGGPRELIEAVLPMTLFSVLYGLHVSLVRSVLGAVAVSAVFVGWRVVARQPLSQAIVGLVGILIGAGLAMWTGRAENFVVGSLIKNSVQAVVFGISAVTPWPILGFFLGLMRGEGFDWVDRPDRLRAYRKATALWAGMFVVRLAVQVPLWMAGAAAVLGLVNVVLGLPLFTAVLWLTWAIVREPGEAARPGLRPGAEPSPTA